MKRKIVTLLFVTLISVSADEAGKSNTNSIKRISGIERKLLTAIQKDTPDATARVVGRRRNFDMEYKVRIPGTQEYVTKTSKMDADYYELLDKGETTKAMIFNYPSVEEASMWIRRFGNRIPVGAPIKVENLGEEAIRFQGAREENPGSLFFRRNTVVVQINAKRLEPSIRIAQLVDKCLKEVLQSEALLPSEP